MFAQRNLGVIQGFVTPFALINDTALKVCSHGRPEMCPRVACLDSHLVIVCCAAPQVNVALDSRLLAQKTLAFHPLTNEASTTITPADLLKFINATGHTYEVIDFDA